MIRNKTNYLIHFKSSHRAKTGWAPDSYNNMPLPPLWFEEYHQIKDTLNFVHAKNNSLGSMLEKYKFDRGLLLSQQISADLKTVYNESIKVQDWAGRAEQLGGRGVETDILKNIKTYFLSEVSQEIRRLLAFKNMHLSMEAELDRSLNSSHPAINQSFSANPANLSFQNRSLNASFNPSYTQAHPMVSMQQQQQQQRSVMNLSYANALERDKELKIISQRLEGLNEIMVRMNQQVYEQGALVDRIDQNLRTAHTNMSKANEHLSQRRDRQQGRGQFTFEGRANKCIMFLYILNVVLILVWFIKHL